MWTNEINFHAILYCSFVSAYFSGLDQYSVIPIFRMEKFTQIPLTAITMVKITITK